MKRMTIFLLIALLAISLSADNYKKYDLTDLGITIELPDDWSESELSSFDSYFYSPDYLDLGIYRYKLVDGTSDDDFKNYSDAQIDNWFGYVEDEVYDGADGYYDIEFLTEKVILCDGKKAVNVEYNAYLWEDYYDDWTLPTGYYENIIEVLYKGYVYGFSFYLEEGELTDKDAQQIVKIFQSIKIK